VDDWPRYGALDLFSGGGDIDSAPAPINGQNFPRRNQNFLARIPVAGGERQAGDVPILFVHDKIGHPPDRISAGINRQTQECLRASEMCSDFRRLPVIAAGLAVTSRSAGSRGAPVKATMLARARSKVSTLPESTPFAVARPSATCTLNSPTASAVGTYDTDEASSKLVMPSTRTSLVLGRPPRGRRFVSGGFRSWLRRSRIE